MEDLLKADATSGNDKLLHSLKHHDRHEPLVVQEPTRAGITEDLAKEVKECKVELERIDQELLELGPFAKDVFHEVSSSQKNDPILMPGMVNPRGSPVGSTPELFIHHYQHPSPLRRSRKGNRQSSGKQANKQANVAKRKSEDGYASSPMSTSSTSLGDERTEVGDRLSTRDNENLGKEQQQQVNSQKGKWRKVGSSGSPSVSQPTQIFKNTPNTGISSTHTSSNNGLSSTEANHFVSPVATSKEKRAKQSRSSNTGVAEKEFDADVNSPSMIPAASEIEMLSLYMPNSPWETIGSSPLQSDHVSSLDIQGAVGSNSSEKATEGSRRTESDKSSRSFGSPRGVSSQKTEKPSSLEAAHGAATPPQKQHPLVAMTTNATSTSSNWQLLLTSSEASRSSDKPIVSQSEARISTPNSHQVTVGAANELKRHVVVRDGTPVCMPSSTSKTSFSVAHLAAMHDPQRREQQDQPNPHHQQHPSVTHMVREHRASMSAERYSPPAALGSPVVVHPHSHHFSSMEMSGSRHRRTSSSSSLRSLKQQHSVDDSMSTHSLPSPLPTHSRVSGSRQTSSPLTQQAMQQIQAMGGVSVGDAKLGNTVLGSDSAKLPLINPATGMPWVPSTSVAASQLAGQSALVGHSPSMANAMNAASLPCYPFSFLPGAAGNWFQTPGGMLASAGLAPSLRPPMLSLDPSSAYKPVFNPLLNYRYPLGVSQSLKGFPSSSSPQMSQPPSGVGLGNINPTSAGSPAPQGTVYPVAPSPNLPGFHSRSGDPVMIGTRNSQPNAGTLPLLCLQPGQTQAFPGMLPQTLIGGGAEDANPGTGTTNVLETSMATPPPPGISWVQNPSGTNLVPYLMGMPPGSQQAVNLLASSQLSGAAFHGSDGNLAKMGGGPASIVNSGKDHPATFAPHRPQPQRRGSSASLDLVRGEISPSNTPPLGVAQGGGVGLNIGGSKRPLSGKGSHDAKWKPGGGDHSSNPLVIHPFEYPSGDSSQSPTHTLPSASNIQMIPPSSHMIQAGFPGMPMMHGHSRLPKGRGEMLIGAGGGRGSPRAIADKPKLRMHHVRDDDFRQPVKPDRRRKRWRGKNRESYLSVRSEETDGPRYGGGKVGDPLPTTLPPFPKSMNVEPGSDQSGRSGQHVKYPLHDEGNGLGPKSVKPGTKSKDGNYALNMLADMSSIQSKERQDGGVAVPTSLSGSHTNESSSNNVPPTLPVGQVSSDLSRHQMRSPVTLAARSLLMLGEDLNKPEGVNGRQPQSVENNAANSLLQLSNAMLSGEGKSTDTNSEQTPVDENCSSSQSTRSASFSAAEAMIMMGSSSEPTKEIANSISVYNEVFPSSTPQSPHSGDCVKTPEMRALGATKSGRTTLQRPQSISLDSEVTDTDSEATLTPDSPRPLKLKYPPDLIRLKIENDEVENDEDTETVVQSSLVEAGLADFQSDVGGDSDHDVKHHGVLEGCDMESRVASDSGQCFSWNQSVKSSPNSKAACIVSEPIAVAVSSSSLESCALSQVQTSSPPALILSKDVFQEDSEVKLQPKLPKFISSFGPVSETAAQSLPVEFDRTDEGDSLCESRSPCAVKKDEYDLQNSREEKVDYSNVTDSASVLSSSSKGQKGDREIDHSSSATASNVLEESAMDNVEPGMSSEGSPKMNSPLSATKEKTKQRAIKIKRHNTRVVPVANTTSSEIPTPGHYSDTSGSLPSWAAFADAAKLSSADGKDKNKDSHIFGLEKLSDDDSDASSITDGILSSGELSRVNKVIESMDENLARSSQEVALEVISDGNASPSDISTAIVENSLPHSEKIPALERVDKYNKTNWDPQIHQQQLSPGIENAGGNGKVYKAQKSNKSNAYSKSSREHESNRDQHHGTSMERTTYHATSDSDSTLTTKHKPQRFLRGSPNRNSHKQHTVNKPVERFSPLSDDELADLASPSQRMSYREPYSKFEVEDIEKKQKRYQGEYYESAATLVPSPASSTSSSSTKKRRSHHHHRHPDRFSGGDVLLPNKREHRKEKSGSTSRGSSPTEHKKRHHHHHHHSSHHHRAHSRDEKKLRESHSFHEGKDDRSFGGSSRLSRDDWHDSNLVSTSGGKSRKRVHASSDEEGVSQDYSKSSSFKPNSKRKMKHHKERWKEHQHGLHKH